MAVDRVDFDDVAIAQQRDRTADRSFGTDMADAETARRAGEAPVGDQRDLAAHALAVKRSRGLEHLAHAGTAARPLIADHQHFAFAIGLVLDGLEALFFVVEAARRTREAQLAHARDFHDRTF